MRSRVFLTVAATLIAFLIGLPAMAQDGTLKVKVKPKTGYTLVDGRAYGQGNRTIRLPAGEHQVGIYRYGYKPHIQKVSITAGQTSNLDVTLEPVGAPVSSPWGRIRLMVNPNLTAVYLNGKTPDFLIGCTGATDTNFIVKQELLVRPGSHTVTLALDGYRTYTTTVTVGENERVEIRHTMQRGDGEDTIPATAQAKKAESRLAKRNNIPREKTGFASMHAAIAPVTVTGPFSANPSSVQCGESSRLTWGVAEAVRAEISGLGEVGASGEKLVTPTQTTTYNLTATGPGGVSTSSATVNVNTTITASLSAAPGEVRYHKIGDKVVEHGTTNLTWSTSNADSVSIDPVGSVSASGTRGVQPTPKKADLGPVSETVTYTLNASNACGGSATQTSSVRVTGSIEALPEVVLASIFFPTDYPDQRNPNLGLLRSQSRALGLLADGFKKYLQYDSSARLLLEAHADERASVSYNQMLAERRAARAKQFLVDAGISSGAIETTAFGEERNLEQSAVAELEKSNPNKGPRARISNRHADWLAHNRRVDIVLRPAGKRSDRYYPHTADDAGILWQVPKPARGVVEKNQ
jgi:hypothetical protein